MLIKECPQEPIPCKQCPVLAICINKKDKVACSILYQHYIRHIGPIHGPIKNHRINEQLLFEYTKALGHTDWTVMNTEKEIWLWTPQDDEMKGELGETIWKQ